MNYLIDASNITNYNLNNDELELNIIFWILVAGKNAKTISKALNNLLSKYEGSPFEIIRNIKDLPNELKSHGIGCYSIKARSLMDLINSNLDLRNCSVDDLENIYGIGSKTARCFLIHTRKNQELAGVDTHLLKFMRDNGYDVPKSTPTKKKYKIIEKQFLDIVKLTKMTVSELDLKIWNCYNQGNKLLLKELI